MQGTINRISLGIYLAPDRIPQSPVSYARHLHSIHKQRHDPALLSPVAYHRGAWRALRRDSYRPYPCRLRSTCENRRKAPAISSICNLRQILPNNCCCFHKIVHDIETSIDVLSDRLSNHVDKLNFFDIFILFNNKQVKEMYVATKL